MGENAPRSVTRKIRGLSLAVSNTIGKYDLVRELGRGSTGVVFEGVERDTGQHVALKIMLPEQDLPDSLQRLGFTPKHFFNEARIAAAIRHANVLRVLDAGTQGRLCYIVLELVPGARSLSEFLQPEHRLPYQRVLALLCRTALALDHVHKLGILHRDVKPGNILLTDKDEVKLCDFSISSKIGEQSLTEIVGSPRYMSPEQLLRRPTTQRSEVFSLGIVLYELLTLSHPFEAEDLKGIVRRMLSDELRPLLECMPGLPVELEELMPRVLARNPAERFATARELADALGGILEQQHRLERTNLLQKRVATLKAFKFFEEFSEEELREVAVAGDWEEYTGRAEIVREGAASGCFYLLVSGSAEIYKGNTLVDQLGPGDCFGEMGFLAGIERTASVVADTPLRAVKFGGQAEAQLSVEVRSKFHRACSRIVVYRLRQFTSMLSSDLKGNS